MTTAEIPEELQVGKLVQLTPESVAHGGALVARLHQRVIFVRHGVLGETATARITAAGPKNRFFYADVISVEKPAPQRRKHPWKPADSLAQESPLGGMEFGHLQPETQRDYKRQVIIDQLTRLGGLPQNHPLLTRLKVQELPAAGNAPADLGWRTRVHFDIDPKTGHIAMHPHRSSQAVPVEDFPLADNRLQELHLEKLHLLDIMRLDLAVTATGQIAVVFTVCAHTTPATVAPALERACRQLWGSLEDRMITLIFTAEKKAGRRRATKPAAVIAGAEQTDMLETATVYAQDYFWQVHATGFWQAHRHAPEVLGNAVLEAANIKKNQTVYDLYAGAGLFTALAADAVGARGSVLSVEGSAVTSRNAAENFSQQGPSRTHRSEKTDIRLERGDVSKVLTRIRSEVSAGNYVAPDVVILDPSREGCGKTAVERVLDLEPQRIVYAACDPASLGRDTGYLRVAGWRPVCLEAFDMYPNTHHVETLAAFEPFRK